MLENNKSSCKFVGSIVVLFERKKKRNANIIAKHNILKKTFEKYCDLSKIRVTLQARYDTARTVNFCIRNYITLSLFLIRLRLQRS